MSGKRVCIIGAGPSGCSALIQFQYLAEQGAELPTIVCYEKQDTYGGLWNFTWRIGTDEYGQPVHGSMYRHLWSNGPKECIEFGDYTFDDHFKQPTPSFPPRTVLFDYLQGRWKMYEIEKRITFNRSVESVEYDDASQRFVVLVKDLVQDRTCREEFDYVIVAGGHYSRPNVPEFPGMQDFPGRVIHAHDFRDANQFKGQRILVVGGSYSGEDIASQTYKFGASHVTISTRGETIMAFKWPSGIDVKPGLEVIQGHGVTFKDGSKSDYDAIILCTGYLMDNRFMEDRLRLRGANPLYPDNGYKGVVWMPAANGQLFYIAHQDQYYTYTMFDVQALYIVKVILGDIKLPPEAEMLADWELWMTRMRNLKDAHDDIDFQTDYVNDLKKICGYPHTLDCAALFHKWEHDKVDSIMGYRDHPFTSIHTGTTSTVHHTPWLQAMSDSLEEFLRK